MTEATPSRDPKHLGLLVFDVDGVLTPGSIIYDDAGREVKQFNVRDGFAIRAAERVGLTIGIITGRESAVVARRMEELKIRFVWQGSRDKAVDLAAMARQVGVPLEQVGFVGDDVVDIPAMRQCGWAAAVADAAADVLPFADCILKTPGGQGAAREAIERVLKAQGKWADVIAPYVGDDAAGRGERSM